MSNEEPSVKFKPGRYVVLPRYPRTYLTPGALMCLRIGTPKIINFPFVTNGKFIIFRCPKI